MIVALYIFLALAAVGTVLWMTDRKSDHRPQAVTEQPDTDQCCGLHEVCEKANETSLNDEIEYFDDEELDIFAGRDAAEYSDKEVDTFRDIMLTMRPDEAPLWARSLERRGIAVPSDLRDELLMLLSDLEPIQQ